MFRRCSIVCNTHLKKPQLILSDFNIGYNSVSCRSGVKYLNNSQLKRNLCSKTTPGQSVGRSTEEAAATNAIVLTPYQKVAATARGGMYLGFAGLALVCGGFIVRELLPTRMNPNHLFGEALDQIVADAEVSSILGTPIRGYGKDHGGHREGRRNFIEHADLQDKDGTPRLRIRFNLRGPNGNAVAYAEVRKGMPQGQWVYLIVQVVRTGEMITIQDNRNALQAETPEEQDAFSRLINGGRQ